MTLKIKYIALLISIITEFASFSQSLTKEKVISGLPGKWRLEYKNENLQNDTACLILKRVVELKKYSGKEFGYFKDGQILKSPIKWDFINSVNNGKITIIFKGGLWVDEQEFIITRVEKNKITMLSCSKHDNCDEAYFIRE